MEKINPLKVSEEVRRLRGRVIHGAIDIEYGMGDIIMNYYVKNERHNEFLFKCLLDESFNFGLKLRLFIKIIQKEPYNRFFEDIRELGKIRNVFAHSLIMSLSGELKYLKDLKKFEVKKAKDLHERFFELHPKLLEELNKLKKSLENN